MKGQQPRVGICWSKAICGPRQRKLAFSHRIGTNSGDWWRMIHAGSDSTPIRHSLASFRVRMTTDPKAVQTLLRHSDVNLTLQFYNHAVRQDRMARSRRDANCDSGPRGGSKRAESKLRKSAGSTKRFEIWWPWTELNRRRGIQMNGDCKYLKVPRLPVSFVRVSSPRPIAFQACESRIHEIPGQGFRELEERDAYAVPIAMPGLPP